MILNIETSTKNCSVALASSGEVLAFKEIDDQGHSHAEKLHLFIHDVLQEANCNFSDLTAIAVGKGPGSYTGLRIGVSAAKGLCYALDIPLISIDTLAVLASPVKINKGLIIPMLDARRMEVYSAVFDERQQQVKEVQAEILTENSYQEINKPIYFVGDCQEKCKSVLKKSNFHFLPEFIFPSAKEMVLLSFQKFQKQDFEDVAYFEPFYLKDFMMVK
jgi:tRNA threonylcarbamoyladenosine biosynthesis protein TsaB